jgi:hypothetical protein
MAAFSSFQRRFISICEGKVVERAFGLKGRGEIEGNIRKALGHMTKRKSLCGSSSSCWEERLHFCCARSHFRTDNRVAELALLLLAVRLPQDR